MRITTGFMIALLLPISAIAQDGPSSATPPKPPGIIGVPGGSGPFPAVAESPAGLATHTLYRPARMPDAALPLIVWGNGGCRDNGLQHAMFLREVASHGYVVIALGRARAERGIQPVRPPEADAPPPVPRYPDETSVAQMEEAITWASSGDNPHKGRIDTGQIAVMGHSCGGLQAIALSADPRIRTSIIFNSGVYNRPGVNTRSGVEVRKDALDRLHAPIAYFAGGPGDIAHANATDDVDRITKVPVFFGELQIGHSGTFWLDENGGDWAKVAVGWLDWHLKGKATAAAMFSGPQCTLCTDPRWTIRRKGFQ